MTQTSSLDKLVRHKYSPDLHKPLPVDTHSRQSLVDWLVDQMTGIFSKHKLDFQNQNEIGTEPKASSYVY